MNCCSKRFTFGPVVIQSERSRVVGHFRQYLPRPMRKSGGQENGNKLDSAHWFSISVHGGKISVLKRSGGDAAIDDIDPGKTHADS